MTALFAVLFIAAFLALAFMTFSRLFFSDAICKPAIREWAISEKIDYAFDDVDWLEEFPFFNRGPFLFRRINTQKVYRLLVTIDGQQKIAYVRVGHWLWGLLHPVVVMRLRKESNQPSQPVPLTRHG
jgi:hypothetical protein